MHAAGRRTLPPVPRPSAERTPAEPVAVVPAGPVTAPGAEVDPDLAETGRFEPVTEEPAPAPVAAAEPVTGEIASSGIEAEVNTAGGAAGEADEGRVVDPLAVDDDDPAQQFVARLRSAAVDFAAAAGADSAVVREAVPPARHRRSRCRVVLRYPDGAESDLTFLGPVERSGRAARRAFDAEITRWLGSGQRRDAAWLVEDPEAPDGFAVDVSAWAVAG